MPSHVQCQDCGALVSGAFARVFGNSACEVYACLSCSTVSDLQNCAATAPDADGTLMVHRPGVDEPQPAVMTSTAPDEESQERVSLTLDEVEDHQRTRCDSWAQETGDRDGVQHDDAQFEALAAK